MLSTVPVRISALFMGQEYTYLYTMSNVCATCGGASGSGSQFFGLL
jgi:hypothetical protein